MADNTAAAVQELLQIFRIQVGDHVEVLRLPRTGDQRVLFEGVVHKVTLDDPEGMLHGRLTVRAHSIHDHADYRRFDLNIRLEDAVVDRCIVMVDRPNKLGIGDDHGRFRGDMFYVLQVRKPVES